MRAPSTIIAFRTGVESTSTKSCCPLGIEIDSPSTGRKSAQVDSSEYRATQRKTRPLVAAAPVPLNEISVLGVSATQGLSSVIHSIVVSVCFLTLHTRLSNLTVALAEAENPVPVRVTVVLPLTEPKRGEIEVRTGVFLLSQVTSDSLVSSLPSLRIAWHL